MAGSRAAALCAHGKVPVMVGPGDEIPAGAGGGGRLPASRANRDQVIATLKAAFVQGRLTKDEFDLRVGQALAIYAELDALTADIPAGPAVPPPSQPALAPDSRKLIRRGSAMGAGMILLIDAVFVIPRAPIPGVIAGILLSAVTAALLTGFLTFLAWVIDRHSGAQSAQGPPPDTGGTAPGRLGPADAAGLLTEIGDDTPHTAEAARCRPSRRPRYRARRPGIALAPGPSPASAG